MRDRERLMRGMRVSWPVNVESTVLYADGSTRTITTRQYDGSTLRWWGEGEDVVVASGEDGRRIGTCSLASALAEIAFDWPVTVGE